WMPEGDGGEDGDEIPSSILPIAAPAQSLVQLGSVETQRAASPAAKRESPTVAKSWSRATICVSSQVGCAVDCQFCMTALLGIQRNLTPGEIAGQVMAVLADRGAHPARDRINLVFMGQGEPFLNYDHWIAAVRLLVDGVGSAEPNMT